MPSQNSLNKKSISKKNILKNFVLLVLLWICFSTAGHAAQDAVVVTDGSMVYKKADFDAPVLSYLNTGRKIRVSSKKFGPFYRVRLSQGTTGYISDVDVQIQGAGGKKASSKSAVTKSAKRKGPKNLMQSFYIGPGFGYLQFKEVISKVEYADSVFLYGAKMTFPLKLLDGPFLLDIEALFNLTPPAYYNKVSSTAPTGFIMIADASANFVITQYHERAGVFYVGVGPLISWTKALVEISGSKQDLQEMRLGGVGTLGTGYHFGDFAVQLGARYFFEKTSYMGFTGALQYGF